LLKRWLLLILSAGLTSPAAAQDPWTGVYVGIHAGYGHQDSRWTYQPAYTNPYSNTFAFGPTTVPSESFSADGVFAGAQIGANYRFGKLVPGLEISYSPSGGPSKNQPISPGAFNSPATTNLQNSFDGLVVVAGRLGYAVTDRWLVYAKGGYAAAKLDEKGTDTSLLNYSFDTGGWSNGWTAGAGAEYRLNDKLSIAVEYAHVGLEDQTRTGQITNLPNFPVVMKVGGEIDAVTVRLNARTF